MNIARHKWWLILIQPMILAASAFVANADEYKLDPAPFYEAGVTHGRFEFENVQDPKACEVYLKNLQHYAKRNTPMSCNRPISPLFKDIKKVEWEGLDPEQYRQLFGEVVAKLEFVSKPTQEMLDNYLWNFKEKRIAFRRAKLSLEGYPDCEDEHDAACEGGVYKADEKKLFYLIQLGSNTGPDLPKSIERCVPKRGGTLSYHYNPKVFIATADLQHLYGYLTSMTDGLDVADLKLIRNHLYAEQITHDGDIWLHQFHLSKPPVILEPACLYHFKRSTP